MLLLSLLLCCAALSSNSTSKHFHSVFLLGFPDNSVGKESTCNAGDPSSIPGSGRYPGEGIGYPLQYSWASLVAQLVKNLPAMREILGLGRSPGEGKGYPLQYSSLENSMECTIHGVTESDTNERLSLPFGTWQFMAVSQKVLFGSSLIHIEYAQNFLFLKTIFI